jgi:RecB family endonuclease NucS
MDRADICYYTDEQIGDGTIPNTVIELKTKRAGSRECNQIVRYLKWLHKRLGNEAERIKFYLLAPSFARTATIPKEYKKQVKLVSF